MLRLLSRSFFMPKQKLLGNLPSTVIKLNRKINMVTRKMFGSVCLSLMMLLGVSGLANATLIYDFDTTAVAAFGAGPYGSVTLTQNGSDVDVTVDLLADMNFVNTGGPHSIFTFNATDVVASDITLVKFDGSSNSNITIVTPGENTPYGTFTFMLDCTAGKTACPNGSPGQTLDPLTFTVLNALELDLVGLSTGGNPNSYFAADVICNAGSCGTGATGTIAVTGGPRTNVPEPGTLALLGIGLVGLGIGRRRRS